MVGTRYHHGAETRPIEDMADNLMEQLQGEIWAIQNKRLAEHLNFNRSQRVADDLDSSYFKTLEELRWQIEWRKKQEVTNIPVKLAPKNITPQERVIEAKFQLKVLFYKTDSFSIG